MPHTHHSHSGSFCNHAIDDLESIVHHAFNVKHMTTVSLTEHMPRPDSQLYPGESEMGWDSAHQHQIFDAFVATAARLRQHIGSRATGAATVADATSYEQQRQVLIGFESEWIDSESTVAAARIQHILDRYGHTFDFWVGSVHHVRGQPIDFDAAGYERALQACGGDENELMAAYFDAQLQLLTTLKPPVVGHFDLIRLLNKTPDIDWRQRGDGRLWDLIERNLRAVKAYDGVLEINTSAWRKGLRDPYPREEIVKFWIETLEGTVVLSDDSHGIAQLGVCYAQIPGFLERCGVKQVGVLGCKGSAIGMLALEELKIHPYWAMQGPEAVEK